MRNKNRALSLLLSAELCFSGLPVWQIQARQAQTVIDVTDFGADPVAGQDSTPAVEKALEKAREADGPVTIRFPRGRYDLYPDRAPERELYVSNTAGTNSSVKNKKIGILVENMNDVTIDGDGSEFVFHGKMTEFAAINSENVTFKNYSTDFEVPTVIDVTVEKTDGNTAIVYVPECYDYEISGTTITWLSDVSPYSGQRYWTAANSLGYTQTYDEKTGLTQRESNQLFSNVTSIEDLGDHRLKFTYSSRNSQVREGLCYQMRYTLRDTPGTFFWKSKDIRLENIDVEYLHGFGMVGQHTENITLDDVDFEVTGEKGRTTAGFADFIQMSGCRGLIDIQNCTFSNPHDDPINIHGTFNQVTRILSDTQIEVTYMHNETAGFPNYFVGDQIEFMTKGNMIPVADSVRTVTAVDGPDGQGGDMGEGSGSLTKIILTLDAPIPSEVKVNSHVVENITWTPDVYIAGNIFKETPTRGILCTTRGEMVIEDNVFDGLGMASIYISNDAQGWYESGPCRNVTIRDNVFIRPRAAAILVEPTNPTVSTEDTVHSSFTIVDNTFYLPAVQVLNAKSVADLTFENNVIYRNDPLSQFISTASDTTLQTGESAELHVEAGSVSQSGRLYSFNGCRNVLLSRNVYDAGLNAGSSLYNMNASELHIENDAARASADSMTDNTLSMTYVSSDPSVVSISAAGEMTGRKAGRASVWAKVTSGARTFNTRPVQITVEGEDVQEKGTLILSAEKENLAVGETLQLQADAEDVTWSVSDSAAASIDENGLLQALSGGPVTVRAQSADGRKGALLLSVAQQAESLSSDCEILFASDDSRVRTEEGRVILTTVPTGLYQEQTPGSALKVLDLPEGDCEVVVRTEGKVQTGRWGAHGLYLMQDQDNYVSLERKERGSGNYKMAIVREADRKASETWDNGSEGAAVDTASAASIWMKLTRSGGQIEAAWSENGTDWDVIGSVDSSFLQSASVVFASLSGGAEPGPEIAYDQLQVNGEAVALTETVLPEVTSLSLDVDEEHGGLQAQAAVSHGQPVYFWAAGDTENGTFHLLDGAAGSQLGSSADLSGKYIQAAAVPMQGSGCGSLVWSSPVRMPESSTEETADSNAYLEKAEISGLSHGFAFDPKDLHYFTQASTEEKTLRISLEAESSKAAVQAVWNGEEVPAQGSLEMKNGRNVLEVKVTAEDGVTFRQYRFVISRTGDSDASLQSLTVDGHSIDLQEGSDTLLAVLENVQQAEIAAAAASASASVQVIRSGRVLEGKADLQPGDNHFQIVVQPEAPAARRVIALTVRVLSDSNADLSGLQTGSVTLQGKFSADCLLYHAETYENTLSLQAEAAMQEAVVSIEANGKTAAGGTGQVQASLALQPGENVIRIHVTSPDGTVTKTTELYVIRKANPADASHDLDVSLYTATAGSTEEREGNEGPVALALDGDPGTWWHSDWTPDLRENLWFDIELPEAMPVNGLRYLPRNGSGTNGIFTKYRIEASSDHGSTYEEISSGEWSEEVAWKLALFETRNVTNIRIYCVENAGDGRAFASAAEIRLLYQPEEKNEQSVYLSDLDWVSETHGNPSENQTERDLSTMKQPLTLWNGSELQTFSKGLGTHADSEIVYDVAQKGYTRFEAWVGVDADTAAKPTEANICFSVLADGEEVFTSGTMHFEENGQKVPMQKVSVSLEGVSTLTLRVRGVNNTWSAHADWADAKFILADAPVQEADKTLLLQAIACAEALQNEGGLETLHPLVLQEFEAALEQARALAADPQASQEAVNASWLRLSSAIQKTGWTSDKYRLQALYEECSALDLSLYEDGPEKEAFAAALQQAKEVLDSETALDETSILPAIKALEQARSALKPRPAEVIDTSLLEMLIGTIEQTDLSLYIQEGQENLQTELAAARETMHNPASQAEVDGAVQSLHQAWLQLRLKADESLLDSLRSFRTRLLQMNRSLYSAPLLQQADVMQQQITELLDQKEIPQDEARALADQAAELAGLLDAEEAAGRPQKPDLNTPDSVDSQQKPAASAGDYEGQKTAGQKAPGTGVRNASGTSSVKPATAAALTAVPAAGLALSAGALVLLRKRKRR